MQVVEDMEECVLRAWLTCKELDIIQQEHIDALVEIDEVVDFLLGNGRGVLALNTRDDTYRTLIRGLFSLSWMPMACNRWVLPTPVEPKTNKGL